MTTINYQKLGAEQQQIDNFRNTISRLRQKVTRLEQELAEASRLANHDELTGLPNRNLLRDRLNQVVIQAKRQKKYVCLLMLDLDGFKDINDSLGHATGDKLLQAVAKRLLSFIRGGDTACRYGGDEFVILLPDINDRKSAAAVVNKLRTQLERPYCIDQHTITVSASIGMATQPAHEINKYELVMQADIAMYVAKDQSNAPPRYTEPVIY